MLENCLKNAKNRLVIQMWPCNKTKHELDTLINSVVFCTCWRVQSLDAISTSLVIVVEWVCLSCMNWWRFTRTLITHPVTRRSKLLFLWTNNAATTRYWCYRSGLSAAVLVTLATGSTRVSAAATTRFYYSTTYMLCSVNTTVSILHTLCCAYVLSIFISSFDCLHSVYNHRWIIGGMLNLW